MIAYKPWGRQGADFGMKRRTKRAASVLVSGLLAAVTPGAGYTETGTPVLCPADHVCVDVAIAGAVPATEFKIIKVTKGDKLAIIWSADRSTRVHIHGYDIRAVVAADRKSVSAFTAHATGRFPVTVHGAGGRHVTLLHVEVHPR